jgi:hypothetical protein
MAERVLLPVKINVFISETSCMYLVIPTYTYHFSRYVSRETNTKEMLILKSPIGD